MHHFVGPLHGLGKQVGFRGVRQPVGRIEYATSAAGDLFIAQSVDFVNKLALTAAGIYYMCVRIAKGWYHGPTSGICRRLLGIRFRNGAHGAPILEFPIADKQPCVVNHFKRTHVVSAEI